MSDWLSKRACDSCRRKKIKCDATTPQCRNCQSASVGCTYNDPRRKRGPKVRRGPSGLAGLGLSPGPTPGHEHDLALHHSPSVFHIDNSTEGSPSSLPLSNQQPSPRSQSVRHETTGPSVRATDRATGWVSPAAVELAAQRVRYDLLVALDTAMPSVPVEDIVDQCISLYLQYYFPICPFVHEPRLRANASLALPDSVEPNVNVSSPPSLEAEMMAMMAMRSFTLVTAVCAVTALNLSFTLFPDGHRIEQPFLAASRDMFRLYEDYDIENPDWTSMAIRLLHSSALHTCGRTGRSWHALGEVRLIATNLYIPSRSMPAQNFDPLEAQMRRFNYWISKMAERSAMVLNNRQVDLRTPFFERSLEHLFAAPDSLPLLDSSRKHNEHPFEERLLTGVDLCCRLWALAADVISKVQSTDTHESNTQQISPSAPAGNISHLFESYIEFIAVLDQMPPWLESPESIVCSDEEVYHYQKTCFFLQRTDLLVTYHCLKMVILHNCTSLDLTAALGLNDEPLAVALQKTQIAYDLLHILDNVPLQSLQVGGEPCVEKIRQVGSILLELVQAVQNTTIKKRAKDCFARLLNYLTQLNSRVSMELSSDFTG
ncbi:hypothetical protein BP6252_06837 [Coleophoma cylindrospora]|uniref:Zn(2)-C6 fungal-type domain-containing protein n=1 Tax=Coleophoma cylindrospora TaxID=1849047 RepID=A0A3D8RG44_9HELO|nr:hypothetical protein BP6252_06837 [Coleophoma cylindrospora]